MWVAIIVVTLCGALSVWGMADIWNNEYNGLQPEW